MNEKEECKNCRYYQESDSEDNRGECHFNPPSGKGSSSGWPHVPAESWCGKFGTEYPEPTEEELVNRSLWDLRTIQNIQIIQESIVRGLPRDNRAQMIAYLGRVDRIAVECKNVFQSLELWVQDVIQLDLKSSEKEEE